MFQWRMKWWQGSLLGTVIGLGAYYCQDDLPRNHAIICNRQAFVTACVDQDSGYFKNLAITPFPDGIYRVNGLYYSYNTQELKDISLDVPGVDATAPVIMGTRFPQRTSLMALMQIYAAQCSWIRYEYRWWREPHFLIWAYPLICAFIFGAIIPALSFLVRGGPSRHAGSRYELDGFGNQPEVASASPIRSADVDSQHSDAGILAVHHASVDTSDGDLNTAAAPGVVTPPKLDGKPLTATSSPVVESPKHFAGEFYPTEIHPDELKDGSKKSP
jgi:hypothetical protein